MNLYLDSSALVKRYVEEDGSAAVRREMSGADSWISSQVTFVETMRVIVAEPEAIKNARAEWPHFEVIAVSPPVCERAVALAGQHRLRSLDAIQLASAEAAGSDLVRFATWDRRLHDAARAEGFRVLPATLG